METRKETLSTLKVCRFCLTSDETLIPLYDNRARAPKKSVPFALKILACIAIEIFPSDNMPQYICQRCKLFMELSYAFKQLCRQADEAILQFIQTGTPLTPMPWPAQLNKVYKATNKSAEANVVKTVVQGGATVKVMAEEVSDSEEGDDDNVYSVKIGDGSEEGKSIKVITSIDNQDQSGTKRGQQDSEDAEISDVALIESGCWPCDECECTYPLEQLLTLHKAQKHRVRTETCEECGGKFFSKYDLESHQLTHTSEMPFQCVACKKKFRRLILLKRHEKVMHSELPQQVCHNCPATFLSIEELQVHQERHHRHSILPFICFICDKRFHDQHILQKHTELVHKKKSAFSCQYCSEQFPSVSKLTRHIREHAGVRPYPCKHCDKSFTKSHHYTRHLRLKHSESVRTAGPYAETDAYRCDECDDTFATQDDLMYHSALHATTNLVCPLCQEKFDDVDTVTAHIKSHVNGTEFMCDFCELIFTTKEKLENHIARSHDDELLANDQETENDESSMDLDAEEDDDDNSINVKEVDGHMVVEIKKAGEYMLPTVATGQGDEECKTDIVQSEDSDVNYTDLPITEVEVIPTSKQQGVVITKDVTMTKVQDVTPKDGALVMKAVDVQIGTNSTSHTSILRKAEEIKRKVAVAQQQAIVSAADKKEKMVTKAESNSTATGASDKSLRLLEKELQDLKRTNTRTEAAKTPVRTVESLRNRRPQLFSSTPKIRTVDRKEAVATRPTPEKVIPTEKKQAERKTTKEPKESKETKTNNNNIKDDKEIKGFSKEDKELKGNTKEDKELKGNGKEDKELKGNGKEEKEIKGNAKEEKEVVREDKKEAKEKETPKVVVKNGNTESSTPAAEEAVRRSTRPSKIKDYAKMIRDNSLNSDDNETDAEDDFEEYKEPEKTPETTRARGRRSSNKQPPAATPAKVPALAAAAKATPPTVPRKRGRPRKEPQPVVPNKIKKDDRSEEEMDPEPMRADAPAPRAPLPREDTPKENEPHNTTDGNKTPEANKQPRDPRPGVIISPSGQTLKKVPIKSLPPGVKPLPLPVNSRLGGGEVTEMQIGKKIVKVQKIVMTKAEVEAMTKKGLLEIKDGTMVLKPGIKLPATDPAALKSTLMGDGEQKKESPLKHDKAAPTRCDLDA